MTHETGKAAIRRSFDSRFTQRYFVGRGIDVGSGDDSLAKYSYMYPGIKSVKSWDVVDGDAMMMASVLDETYDFLNSSHCLEHMIDPFLALWHWVRIVKPGGHIVIVVPDFEQYEQGFWPSRFNPDHKWSFSIDGSPRHPRHVILLDPENGINRLFENKVRILKIELVARGYVHDALSFDQSLSIACEPAIEIVCRKRF